MERKELPEHRRWRGGSTGETEASNSTHKGRTALLFHLPHRNTKNKSMQSSNPNCPICDKTTNGVKTVTEPIMTEHRVRGGIPMQNSGFNSDFHYINANLEKKGRTQSSMSVDPKLRFNNNQ